MPRYRFVARDAEGREQRGTREAASEALVLEQLHAGGLLALDVERTGPGAESAAAIGSQGFGLWRLLRPRALDVELGLQQIAFMLKSGLSLLAALRTAAAQSARRSMARVWTLVGERIQMGVSLSEALSAHRCFPRLAVAMVSVGEQTGVLDEALLRAAAAMERRRNLSTSVRTALLYPSIVLFMALGVVAFLVIGLIPKLAKMLQAFGRHLPAITQALLDVSAFLHAHTLQGAIGVAAAAGAIAAFYAWPPGRVAVDRILLSVPIVGGVLRLSATAGVARNLGALLESGVRITEGLAVLDPLLRNRYVAGRVAAAREQVLQGGRLSEPLSERAAFLPMLSSMVAVGETSGALDEALDHVARFHEMRLEAVVRRLNVLVEPIIVIVVGGIVGFVYLAFFLALYGFAGGHG